MKKILVGSTVLLLAGTLAACGKSNQGQASTKQISLMQSTELLSLDNSNLADFTQWNVLENSMEGLYRANSKNNPAPAMASKVVKPTDGGKVYTFNLRKNAKWSNGDAVTATDFVKSWERSVAPTAKSGYNYIFSGIKNADAISAGKKSPQTMGVKALNQHTFRVTLEHPMPYFSKMMVLPAFFPQNQKAVKKFGVKYGTNSSRMYYNGPFKVVDWTGSNDKWALTRNKNYYDQKAIHLNQINMQVVKDPNTAHNLFTQGRLDDAQITGVTAKGMQKNRHLVHVVKAGTYYARLNLANGQPLKNQKMRQALNLVVDRNKLTKDVLADGSTPATTFTAPKLTTDPTTGKDFATETAPKEGYNVKKAQQLWAAGKKEAGLKGAVKLLLLGDDETVTKNVAEFLQASVQQNLSNTKVSLKNVPAKTADSLGQAGKFSLSQTLWLADFADPISFMTTLTANNPLNQGKYASAKFDQEVTAAGSKNANSQTAYWRNMRQAEKQLNNDAPVVPLYNMVQSHLVNNKLHGVMYHPVGENDYTRAYLK